MDYDPVALAVAALRGDGWLVTSRHPQGPEVFPHPRVRRRHRSEWTSCPVCELERTVLGHDPCIANLAGVAWACCGHDRPDNAYVITENGRDWRGPAAALFRWRRWVETDEGRAVVQLAESGWSRAFWWVHGEFTPRGRHGACMLPRAECTCPSRARRMRRRPPAILT